MPDPRDPRGFREVVPERDLIGWAITWLEHGDKRTLTFPAVDPEDAIGAWRIEWEREGVELIALVRVVGPP